MGGRYWVWLGVRLLVAVAIVAWAASYLSTGSGEKEFQKTLEAMRQVRSFRATLTATPYTQKNELQWEVDCDRNLVHSQRHYVNTCSNPPDCGKQADFSQEELDGAVHEYARQNDGSWAASRYQTGMKAVGFCGGLAQGAEIAPFPPIATMIKRGILQKGDKKEVNGVKCREWLVTMKGAPNGLEHDTVCLGLEDRLPYEWTVDWEHSRASFSDYNTAIQFDLPEEVLRETSASGSN